MWRGSTQRDGSQCATGSAGNGADALVSLNGSAQDWEEGTGPSWSSFCMNGQGLYNPCLLCEWQNGSCKGVSKEPSNSTIVIA